jgi:DNA polymerase III delta prime subunit
MHIDELKTFHPQKIFLVQGTDASFDTLLASAIVIDPFTYSLSAPRFTASHARNIVTLMSEGQGEERTLLIYFSVFSPDAAQILLKSLEEPDMYTTVAFVTPYPYTVPQTIRSRLTILHSDVETKASLPFKTANEALTFIKDEFGKESEDDAATKRARAIEFLDALETQLKGKPKLASYIYEAKDMLFKANMPTKFVLEYAVSMVL